MPIGGACGDVAGGHVAFLTPVVGGLWRPSMIRRTGLPMAELATSSSSLAAAAVVTAPVEVLVHEAVAGPMTFGIGRPVILRRPTPASGARPSCGAR